MKANNLPKIATKIDFPRARVKPGSLDPESDTLPITYNKQAFYASSIYNRQIIQSEHWLKQTRHQVVMMIHSRHQDVSDNRSNNLHSPQLVWLAQLIKLLAAPPHVHMLTGRSGSIPGADNLDSGFHRGR